MYVGTKGERFSKQAAAQDAINTMMQFCCHAFPINLQASSCVLVQSLYGQIPSLSLLYLIKADTGGPPVGAQRVQSMALMR